eukprot:SAG31_NODE_4651_length_3068_cov_1.991580_3_plen_146_part_00
MVSNSSAVPCFALRDDAGFSTIVLGGTTLFGGKKLGMEPIGSPSWRNLTAYLRYCEAIGVQIIMDISMAINDTPRTHAACADGSCWADIEAKIEALSDYRAIVAWYTCDECDALLQSEPGLLSAMQEAHGRIHRLDDRPVLHVCE